MWYRLFWMRVTNNFVNLANDLNGGWGSVKQDMLLNETCSCSWLYNTSGFNPNWHAAGRIYPPYNFLIGFYQLNFQTFLEVKIEINRNNLTPCQAHWVLQNLLLCVAKDEHFSYFHSSCQLGLRVIFDQWPKLNLGFDVQPEIRILKILFRHLGEMG